MQSFFSIRGKAAGMLLTATVLMTGCSATPVAQSPKEAVLVGMMIDNHENARAYQRGLEHAVFVEEQFVEGWITRFEAVFDVSDLPESAGPIRSVRSYFIDGVSPVVSAILHAGGSPDALMKLTESGGIQSFNALMLHGPFDRDDAAPGPHDLFISGENIRALAADIPHPTRVPLPLFPTGDVADQEPVTDIIVDFRSSIHSIAYSYDAATRSYVRTNRGAVQRSSPGNIVILETDAAVTGEFGRLTVRMNGTGNTLLFRDGGLTRGTWTKEGAAFFSFADEWGKPYFFREGQVWIIVLDSLERVTWESGE